MKIRMQGKNPVDVKEFSNVTSIVIMNDYDVPIAGAVNIDNGIWLKTATENNADELQKVLTKIGLIKSK